MTIQRLPVTPGQDSWRRTQQSVNQLAGVVDTIVVNVKSLGAIGDGNSDDTAAFQRAAASHKRVHVPEGTYNVSDRILLTIDGACWSGDGIHATTIRSTIANKPIFGITSSLGGVTIREMALDRTVTATTGGDGLSCSSVSIGQAHLENLLVKNQNNGLSLGPTDWSEITHVTVEMCQNIGVSVSTTATDGACQWSMDTVLSQMNGAQGFLWQSAAGPSQMTIGTMKNCATFANTGVGVAFVGSSGVPLQGVRIVGGFYGEDGNHVIFLDTYGDQHMITGAFVELAGSRTTGPALATAASGIGSGISVSTNNTGVQITGVHTSANSYEGIDTSATSTYVSGCRAINNGQAAASGRRSGIRSLSGRLIIVGGRSGNTGAGASQQYGAFVADGNNLSIGFCDLTGNATAAWGATANVNYVSSGFNLPNTLNVGLAPAGSVLVGGGATGSFAAAGTINVAGGLLKNNTAYSNP